MWKREELPRPQGSGEDGGSTITTPVDTPTAARLTSDGRGGGGMEREIVNIGKSVVIKGELTGSEDLTIEGQVEGKIELRDHVLTIGPNGRIKAQIFAKSVTVLGEVTGNIIASEKVDIRDKGSVDGDIVAPRVAIAEGAHFRGSVDMQRAGISTARPVMTETKAEPKVTSIPPAAAAASQSQRVSV